MRSEVGVAVILVAAGVGAWAQPCEASGQVQAAIQNASLAPGAAWAEKIGAARTVRDRFSEDYFAHRFYQEQLVTSGISAQAARDEYGQLLAQHPDEVMYVLLSAHVLEGTDTKLALAQLDQVLNREPANPHAHMNLAEIYSSPAFLDQSKLRDHLVAYWKSCPNSLSGYNLADGIRDAEFNGAAAAHFRSVIEHRSDEDALRMYSMLWEMEFRAVPVTRQDPVREHMRMDAARLRTFDPEKRPWLAAELRQAYLALGDKDGLQWVQRVMPLPIPATTHVDTPSEVMQQWRMSRRAIEDFQNFNERTYVESAKWVARWPNDVDVRRERFQAVLMTDTLPEQQVVQAAQEWIAVYESNPRGTAPYLDVAQFYAQHRIRFQDIPALLEKALKTVESRPRQSSYSFGLHARESAARIYAQLKMYDRARELYAQIEPELERERAAATSESAAQELRVTESLVYGSQERMARIEGRTEDVLKYGRLHALAQAGNDASMRTVYRANLLRLWKEVKGSEDGFEAWFGQR